MKILKIGSRLPKAGQGPSRQLSSRNRLHIKVEDGLFLLGGNGILNGKPGSVEDAFFFSIQTFAGIGYGVMSPQTTYANTIVWSYLKIFLYRSNEKILYPIMVES